MSRKRKDAGFDEDATEKNRFFVIVAIVIVLLIGVILIINGLTG